MTEQNAGSLNKVNKINGLRVRTVILLSLWAAVSLGAISFLTVKYNALIQIENEYRNLLIRHQKKSDQLEILAATLQELETKITDIEEANSRIIKQIGIDPVQGIGGLESSIRGSQYRSLIRSKDNELVRDLWLRLQNVKSRNQEQDLLSETLKDYLAKRTELVSAIPAIRPVNGGWISSGFKLRRDPFTKEVRMHEGIDISHVANSPIVTTASGIVTYAGWQGNYGRSVWVAHGFGFETRYAHLNKILVKPGQHLVRGETIGLLGSSGRSTGPHVHYEVRVEGRAVNPINFFNLLKNS